MDWLWFSASFASSRTSSPLSNHVLGVNPSLWHEQERAQRQRRSAGSAPPRPLESCMASEMQILGAEKQTLKPSPGHKGLAKVFKVLPHETRDRGDHIPCASQPCAQEEHPKPAKLFAISFVFWAPQIKKTTVTERVRHGSRLNPPLAGAVGCQDLGQAHTYSIQSQLTGTNHPAVTFRMY